MNRRLKALKQVKRTVISDSFICAAHQFLHHLFLVCLVLVLFLVMSIELIKLFTMFI